MNNLSFSEVIYLFGDKFARAKSFLSSKQKLPNGAEVNSVDLCNKMVIGAFAELFSKKAVHLSEASKKFLFLFKKKVVRVEKGEASINATGVEQLILDGLTRKNDAFSIVYAFLNDDVTDPWGEIIRVVKNALVAKHVLKTIEVKKFLFKNFDYVFEEGQEESGKEQLDVVTTEIDAFSKQPFFKLLEKEFSRGVTARQEHPDIDDSD